MHPHCSLSNMNVSRQLFEDHTERQKNCILLPLVMRYASVAEYAKYSDNYILNILTHNRTEYYSNSVARKIGAHRNLLRR